MYSRTKRLYSKGRCSLLYFLGVSSSGTILADHSSWYEVHSAACLYLKKYLNKNQVVVLDMFLYLTAVVSQEFEGYYEQNHTPPKKNNGFVYIDLRFVFAKVWLQLALPSNKHVDIYACLRRFGCKATVLAPAKLEGLLLLYLYKLYLFTLI